jgi:hypothetical protein
MKLEFSVQIFEINTEIINLINIYPVAAELFHADGQTDTTKLIVAFRNFANAPCIQSVGVSWTNNAHP